jgi:2-hydroxy-3-keto-5-methylthiopentenyl-1-phosphate phosphatase
VERRADRVPSAGLRVLVDFDGTFADMNVGVELLERFSPDSVAAFRAINAEYHAGRITLREGWDRQSALYRNEDRPRMVQFVRDHVHLRPGARELVALLERHHVPLDIVSGGFDFYIAPLLEREHLTLPVESDSTADRPDGPVEIRHPFEHPTCRLCGICKALSVERARASGGRVVFIGDGATDRFAAETADLVFARRRLTELCRAASVPFYPFEDLFPVVERLQRWVEGAEPWPPYRRVGVAGSPCPISRGYAEGSPGVRGPVRSDELSTEKGAAVGEAEP